MNSLKNELGNLTEGTTEHKLKELELQGAESKLGILEIESNEGNVLSRVERLKELALDEKVLEIELNFKAQVEARKAEL